MINYSIYKKRRQNFAKHMKSDSIAMIESSSIKIRNNDSTYRFRQCSNFLYLTGYNEPDAVLLIYKNKKSSISHFFSKKPNDHDSIWTGELLDSEEISKTYKFDRCDYLDSLDHKLIDYLKRTKSVYHSLVKNSFSANVFDSCILNIEKGYRKGVEIPSNLYSMKKIIHQLRLIKNDDEISLIRKACDISADAHKKLMRICKANISEKALESNLIYNFGLNNATEAYTSIVASGKNACILHYINNSSMLNNGELLLTDAACEFQNYASDITRTIPINGKFTSNQKLIYNLVLKAQKKAIEKCIVGNTLRDVHMAAVRILSRGLIDIGLLKKDYKTVLKKELYKKFYMHNTGHWLGLDVHDPSDYVVDEKPVTLKPGMIFTVEPGLYIRPDKSVDKKFHNIGIRIEDDILITSHGPEVLTAKAPKSVREIEQIMNSNNE